MNKTKTAALIILTLTILLTTNFATAQPPVPNELHTTVHWVNANNSQGHKVTAFSPQSFKVALGSQIELMVSNRDAVGEIAGHPIRVTDPDGLTVGEITPLNPGETKSLTFTVTKIGIYKFACRNFVCNAHPYMSARPGTDTYGVIEVS